MACILIYDDDLGLAVPYGWDDDCAGAVCSNYFTGVAIFPDAKAARKALAISAAFAKLRMAQGLLPNIDFTTERRHVRIVKLVEENRD